MDAKPEQRPELLTLRELSEYLRVGMRTAYKLAESGDVPAAKVGGQWRISRSALERQLAGSDKEQVP